jgi:hypothetical protein
VAAGNILLNKYTLIGKTLIWSLDVYQSTIGGTASSSLRVAFPTGLVPLMNQVQNVVWAQCGGIGAKLGVGNVNTVGPRLELFYDPAMTGPWTVGTANVRVAATVFVELQ